MAFVRGRGRRPLRSEHRFAPVSEKCQNRPIMRHRSLLIRSVAMFMALAYTSLSSYCLVYAAVTGEGHHASTFASSAEGSHGSDGHSHDHGASSNHQPSSGETDPCCTKLTQNFAALPVLSRLTLDGVGPTAIVPIISPHSLAIFYRDGSYTLFAQDPTGPPGRSVLFKPSSPRAPPIS